MVDVACSVTAPCLLTADVLLPPELGRDQCIPESHELCSNYCHLQQELNKTCQLNGSRIVARETDFEVLIKACLSDACVTVDCTSMHVICFQSFGS